MTSGKRRRLFPGRVAAALAGTLIVAACSTTEDVAEAPGRSGQPVSTDSYPNLNIPPKAATSQLTQEETQAKLAHLTALQHRQDPGSAASAEAARKRLKLAADEQEETLKIIEGQ
ncbi:hypothetical protein ABUE31_04920 [Mesorhizobium sp. ZMM04-5]|uniref:DUF4398 domain-containing protein n=1 Tax=Mesorhizobium marinum TaxID=3228790 RepID=A0ABV3QWV6_9HYPH